MSFLYSSILAAIPASIKKLSLGFYENTEGIVTFILPSELKKTILFVIASKTVKYLGTNLAKELNHLYTENIRQ